MATTSYSGFPTSLNMGGLPAATASDPFYGAKQKAGWASEVGGITRDIFSGIFGEGGTDFGSIASDLLSKMQGVGDSERQRAFRGIDTAAGEATANASNRLGQFGNMDPEQFARVAGDIDIGRIGARGDAEAQFAGMDRQMNLGMLNAMPGLMNAQNAMSQEFGGVAMNILNSAPTIYDGGQAIRRW